MASPYYNSGGNVTPTYPGNSPNGPLKPPIHSAHPRQSPHNLVPPPGQHRLHPQHNLYSTTTHPQPQTQTFQPNISAPNSNSPLPPPTSSFPVPSVGSSINGHAFGNFLPGPPPQYYTANAQQPNASGSTYPQAPQTSNAIHNPGQANRPKLPQSPVHLQGPPTPSQHVPQSPNSYMPPGDPTFSAPPSLHSAAISQKALTPQPAGPYPGHTEVQNLHPTQPPASMNRLPPPPLPQQHVPSFTHPQGTESVSPGQQPSPYPPSPATYPQSIHGQQGYSSTPGITHGMSNLGIDDAGRPIDILQEKRLLPMKKHEQKPLRFDSTPGDRGLIPPKRENCSPEVFRCTLNAIPSTQALLNKVKLPLGLIIHPFKDLSSLPVISAGTIVRCRRCRTYINPFVNFLDERRWRCNLCFTVNDVPEEFLHHPVTKTYGEPHTRPECTNATLEFIAPQEYMVRPPQPAVYMFLLDVSHAAVETGYLQIVCDALLDHIDHLPGDARTKVGFLTYNGTVHFYRMGEGLSQPQMLVVTDIDDVFSPTPDCLLVNLRERKELVCDLLRQLPDLHAPSDNLACGEVESQSALGAALQVAHKLMMPYGGRITVFQQSMPTVGPGALKPRENPNSRAGESSAELLNPSTDFYKKLALECSAHQVAVDFFFMNSQYVDIATLSCSSRFSAGDLHYYPGLHIKHNPMQAERLVRDLDRYLTRKIGFEAVMRIRCTKGVAIHTFHGNFFVRSTDLLALANINPDAGFGLNLSIEESLTDLSSVCIQAALLYTSSKGERRIRVHTMCFPVAKYVGDIFNNVDSDAVVALLSKMAVDRSITASIPDARDALLNAVIDPLKVFKDSVMSGSPDRALLVPQCMRTFPLAISCLFKHPAFRSGVSTRLDDRVFSMIDLKMQPSSFALQSIHPDLYRVDNLTEEGGIDLDERIIPQPPLLPLSAEYIYRDGVYLLDTGWHMYLYVGALANREFLINVLGVQQFSNIEDPMYTLPDLDNPMSETFHNFAEWLQDQRPHYAPMQVIREDSRDRYFFMMCMRQDKTESSMSFQEFLQHVQQKMQK